MRLNSEIIVTIIGDYFSNYYSKFIMKKRKKRKKEKEKEKKIRATTPTKGMIAQILKESTI